MMFKNSFVHYPYLVIDIEKNRAAYDANDGRILTAIDVYVMNRNAEHCFQRIQFANVKILSREKTQRYQHYSLRIISTTCNKQTSKKIRFKKGLKKN